MTSRVVVSIRVPVGPAEAFALFTEKIGAWWVHNDLLRHTPRSPGALSFQTFSDHHAVRLVETLPNGKVFEIGTASVWSPGERLVVGWRQATFGPDHATEVEVRFEPVGGETRVTVEHRGWDGVPQDHVARHGFPLQNFLRHQAAQWRDGLDRLAGLATTRKNSGASPDD